MSPETFEEFLKKLHTVTERNVLVGHPEILLEKQGMITLWCLANMESFRSIGDRFGISKSTCWSVVYRISFKILEINRMYKIISWPSRQSSRFVYYGSISSY
ncbi:DDE superfamily endonuclease [Popillia japonica]|uniref:DDE superfamily endonuclease n=1 Tax=Popillia japonica TaxID=7064 RepID=A0AAW1I7S6_POPJA